MGSEMCIRDSCGFQVLLVENSLVKHIPKNYSGLSKSVFSVVVQECSPCFRWVRFVQLQPVSGKSVARLLIVTELQIAAGAIGRGYCCSAPQPCHRESTVVVDNFIVEDLSASYCTEYDHVIVTSAIRSCLLYTSPSPRDLSTSRMPSSA